MITYQFNTGSLLESKGLDNNPIRHVVTQGDNRVIDLKNWLKPGKWQVEKRAKCKN